MNRMAPCADCGCPILFHRPGKGKPGQPPPMVCDECSKKLGAERVCPNP